MKCAGDVKNYRRGENIVPIRDFVLPPSDPIEPYFDVLKEKFGFGSAYQPKCGACCCQGNTRNKIIEVKDFKAQAGWRIVKEFAWEHQMPRKQN